MTIGSFNENYALGKSVVNTDNVYKDSSLDHCYWSRGVEETDVILTWRLWMCGCQPCLRLNFENCEMMPTTHRAADRNHSSGVWCDSISCASVTRGTPHSKCKESASWVCEQILVCDNIIVWQTAEERLKNSGEVWFVVTVEEKPGKLKEARVYATVPYSKGNYIVSVRWYVFDASRNNDNTDKFYTNRSLQWIPCGSIFKGQMSEWSYSGMVNTGWLSWGHWGVWGCVSVRTGINSIISLRKRLISWTRHA